MSANQAQEAYWTSSSGLKWIEHELALDTAMAGMLDVVLDAAEIGEADRVLDVGCGTGASTIAAAQRVPEGLVVGLDISKPLLMRAAERAREAQVGNVSFLLGDAQTFPFQERRFDTLVSRLGMSFFSDTVSALKNLALALKIGGRMAFVSWAGVDLNPWFSIPKMAAEARLGPLAAGDPRAPGPTALQDARHVIEMITRAGLSCVASRAAECTLTPPGGVKAAAHAASHVGPAARVIAAHKGDQQDAEAIESAVAKAFLKYERQGNVRVPAVVNLFTCRT